MKEDSPGENPAVPERNLFEALGGETRLTILLRNFYATAREDDLLGPVFSRVTNWPAHLQTVLRFWVQVTGGPSEYPGGLAARHGALPLTPAHYDRWLALWSSSCRLHFDPPEAEPLIALAGQFKARLERNLHGKPASATPSAGPCHPTNSSPLDSPEA